MRGELSEKAQQVLALANLDSLHPGTIAALDQVAETLKSVFEESGIDWEDRPAVYAFMVGLNTNKADLGEVTFNGVLAILIDWLRS